MWHPLQVLLSRDFPGHLGKTMQILYSVTGTRDYDEFAGP